MAVPILEKGSGMNIENMTGIAGLTGPGTKAKGTAPSDESFADILAAFEKEAAKTPAERARDEVLKKHHLSEDDYRALPPDKREPIDREIAEAVRRACAKESNRQAA
jgi:hypothetical protein